MSVFVLEEPNKIITPSFELDKWVGSDLMTGVLNEIRILESFFPNELQTKSRIAKTFKLDEQVVRAKIDNLKRTLFITEDSVTFGMDGFGRERNIQVYQLSELARFMLHHMNGQFLDVIRKPTLTNKSTKSV